MSIDMSTPLRGIRQPVSNQTNNQLVGEKAQRDWEQVGNDCMAHSPHSNLSMMICTEVDLDISHPFAFAII